MGVTEAPVEVRITRWPDSFPQYLPGHLDRLATLESALAAAAPGVYVAGAGYRGIGIPACVGQGRDVAARALAG
jgi:oxygen-dependent protoporphyrinogen oxidase